MPSMPVPSLPQASLPVPSLALPSLSNPNPPFVGIDNLPVLQPILIQNISLPSVLFGPNILDLILSIFDRFIASQISAQNPAHNNILQFIIRASLVSKLEQILYPIRDLFLTPNDILAITIYSLSSVGVIII